MPDKQVDPRGTRFMDWCSKVWELIGDKMKARPAMIIGLMIGAVVFIGVLTYAAVRTTANAGEIKDVQAAFCNGDQPYDDQQQENCRKLLDQLLKDPSPEQARRLRKIVETK